MPVQADVANLTSVAEGTPDVESEQSFEVESVGMRSTEGISTSLDDPHELVLPSGDATSFALLQREDGSG